MALLGWLRRKEKRPELPIGRPSRGYYSESDLLIALLGDRSLRVPPSPGWERRCVTPASMLHAPPWADLSGFGFDPGEGWVLWYPAQSGARQTWYRCFRYYDDYTSTLASETTRHLGPWGRRP